jgi:hypothetical protein
MVHHRERLPLALEPGEHLVGVHPETDHLEGDGAPERLQLLGLVDRAHAALAKHADDAVGTNAHRVEGAGRRWGPAARDDRGLFGGHVANLVAGARMASRLFGFESWREEPPSG